MNDHRAIDVVARRVIRDAVIDTIGDMWEMYPEVGEDDWDRVCAHVDLILATSMRGPDEEFDAAYGLLRSRASAHAR